MIPCFGEIKTNVRRETTCKRNLQKEAKLQALRMLNNLKVWVVEQRKVA